jgi:hypothetical protein
VVEVAGEIEYRDFINKTLLPKLERDLVDEARGNKHYLAGFEGALKAMTQFFNQQLSSHNEPLGDNQRIKSSDA